MPKISHCLRVGRHGGEVFGDGGLVPGCLQEPAPRRMRVGHRLLGGEGLGGHQEQDCLRVHLLQRLHQVSRVHVGDEMDAQIRAGIRLERRADHLRAQVRAADADVDDIRDGLAGVAFPRTRAHRLAEGAHMRQHPVDLRHHILPVHVDGGVGAVAQRHVQHRPLFGRIDLLPAEHRPHPQPQPGLLRQSHQQRYRPLRDAVLRIVEQDFAQLQREFFEALGILGEQIAHVDCADLLLVFQQCLPGRRFF